MSDEATKPVKSFRVQAVRKGYFQGILRFPGEKFTVTEDQFSDADRDDKKRRGKGWMRKLAEKPSPRGDEGEDGESEGERVSGRKVGPGLPTPPGQVPDVKSQLSKIASASAVGGSAGAVKPLANKGGAAAAGGTGAGVKPGGRESDKQVGG